MISRALYSLLGTKGVLTAFSNKVYPIRTPDGIVPPFAIYAFDTIPENTKDSCTLDIHDLYFTIFAKTYESGVTLAETLRAALDRYTGTVSSEIIDKIMFQDYREGFDEAAKLFQFDQQYKVRNKL